jgi:hypothetical protein
VKSRETDREETGIQKDKRESKRERKREESGERERERIHNFAISQYPIIVYYFEDRPIELIAESFFSSFD